MKKENEAYPEEISLQGQWRALTFTYILFGAILLLVGLRDAIHDFISYMGPPPMLNCLNLPADVCIYRHMQAVKQGIYLGLAIAATGGSLAVLPPLLQKDVEEVRICRESRNRPRQYLRLAYLFVGGIFLLIGLRHTLYFRTDCIFSITGCRQEVYKGLALIGASGSLAILPLFVMKDIEEAYDAMLSLQRLQWAIQLGYLLVGGILLLTGLQYAQSYLTDYFRGCFNPAICLTEFNRGLIRAAVGGSLIMLPHILRKLVRRRLEYNRTEA